MWKSNEVGLVRFSVRGIHLGGRFLIFWHLYFFRWNFWNYILFLFVEMHCLGCMLCNTILKCVCSTGGKQGGGNLGILNKYFYCLREPTIRLLSPASVSLTYPRNSFTLSLHFLVFNHGTTLFYYTIHL